MRPGGGMRGEDNMTEEEARAIDMAIARLLRGKLCEGCPPTDFLEAPTRCLSCPRRAALTASQLHPRGPSPCRRAVRKAD